MMHLLVEYHATLVLPSLKLRLDNSLCFRGLPQHGRGLEDASFHAIEVLIRKLVRRRSPLKLSYQVICYALNSLS
jgi:hypothetical protein